VLCKHEVVGSIPSGSTIRTNGDRTTENGDGDPEGRTILDGRPRYPSDAEHQFRRVRQRSARRKARRARREDSVLRRPSSVFRRISDIVKRKRIRSYRKTDDGDQEDGLMIRSLDLRSPSSGIGQPVVGLQPDRSDPRMRLKQNWSFRRQGGTGDRKPVISDRNDAPIAGRP
jgi:hypothetical protein